MSSPFKTITYLAAAACATAAGLAVIGTSCSQPSTKTSSTAGVTVIRSDYAPGEITRLCRQALSDAEERFARVAKAQAGNADAALLEFENAVAELGDRTNELTFMGFVSPSEEIRKEASSCEEEAEKFEVSIFTRKDLYLAVRDSKTRNAEEERLRTETVKKFEQNGLHLPDEQLAVVKTKLQRLAVLGTQFEANLNNDTSTVEFSQEELTGVPASFLSRLQRTADGKKYIVTTKTPDYRQVMENAVQSETRKRMQHAYFNRAASKNIAILDEAFVVRREVAGLLGFKNWGDYRTKLRMAKTSDNVFRFLGGLRTQLAGRNARDLADLLRFKKKALDPQATELKMWDLNYLGYQLKKQEYQLDDEKIREFLPTEKVLQGIFDVYSRVLGVQFREVKNANVWAPDVRLYEIVDGKNTIAYFYTDFYPRPGKYGHYAAFSLHIGRRTPNGYRQPVSAIVGNFTPAGNGKPSLLNHEEVETLFHEFGHIMHQTLTRAPYASLAGSKVPRDFVEAISQMFEEWAWNPKILAQISGHYARPNEKLPPALIKQMIRARHFNQGFFYTRQLFLALLDMTYHTSPEKLDVDEVYGRLFLDITKVEPFPGGHFPAGFTHLMGYDAGYYGYLWSEVYAADLATRFEKRGLLDTQTGLEYRKAILEQGNMADAEVLVRKFLKRAHSQKAFLKKISR